MLSYESQVSSAIAIQQLDGSVSTENALDTAHRGGLRVTPTVLQESTRTGATDGRFDAGFLNRRNTVDSTFDVHTEHLPVKVEQRKRKLFLHLRRNNNS